MCAYNHFANTQVQLATSQKLLVELIQFHNMYNAQVINDKYCCCDISQGSCEFYLRVLKGKGCLSKCNTWFKISLSPCEPADSCSAATAPQWDAASVDNLDYNFEFIMHNSTDTVSVNRFRLTSLNLFRLFFQQDCTRLLYIIVIDACLLIVRLYR